MPNILNAISLSNILINICSGTDAYEDSEHDFQAFRPGWKDIFRMNQNELESEIRKVSRDSTLDPRRKTYLIQNLMTRYISSLVFYKPYLHYNDIDIPFLCFVLLFGYC